MGSRTVSEVTHLAALKKLTSPKSLAVFAETVFETMHVKLPLEYLGRGDVYAWIEDDGVIIAGFTLILIPPFRVLTVIPEQNYDNWFREQLVNGLVGELNGVFVTDRAKSVISGGMVIREAIFRFLDTGKTCALFGYNKDRKNLGRLWNRPIMNPVCLLDGAVTPPAGYTTSCNVYMGYFRSDHIRRAFRVEKKDKVNAVEILASTRSPTSSAGNRNGGNRNGDS